MIPAELARELVRDDSNVCAGFVESSAKRNFGAETLTAAIDVAAEVPDRCGDGDKPGLKVLVGERVAAHPDPSDSCPQLVGGLGRT